MGIGTCTDVNVVIPREHNGLPVDTIQSYAFSYCSNLVSIYIPDTVTEGMYDALPNGITVYLEAETTPNNWYPDWNNMAASVYYGVKASSGIIETVDKLQEEMGDISAALDELHTYAQSLASGGEA